MKHYLSNSISFDLGKKMVMLTGPRQVGKTTLAKELMASYLDILEALYIIFLVRPFHRNIARAILKEPKVYFFDSAYVIGDEGVKWENTCATMLLKHIHFEQDIQGMSASLHYMRTKEGAEVDFVICENDTPTQLIECKYADKHPAPSLVKFAKIFPEAECIQLVRELRQEEFRRSVTIVKGAEWLAELSA